MTVPSVELAPRLVAYVVILVAVPLSFVLLFRLVDSAELDGVSDRQMDAGRDWSQPPNADVDPNADGEPSADRDPSADGDPDDERVRCRECGAKNEPAYTFCRYCQARIGM